ncbi:MAG: hypothetical protein IKN55_03930 [Oscillospiraceae bacterium]|nr:hypothetical protein [Oscillospiraceae bacterium]
MLKQTGIHFLSPESRKIRITDHIILFFADTILTKEVCTMWEDFEASGSVADYLAYAAMKELEHAECEGRRAGTEAGRRTGQVH